MELHKAQLDVSKGGASAAGMNPNAIPLAQLLKNPQALNALSSLTGLQGLSSLTSLLAPDSQSLAAAVAAAQAAQRQKTYQPKLRSSSSTTPQQQGPSVSPAAAASNANGSSPKESKRSKFAPYWGVILHHSQYPPLSNILTNQILIEPRIGRVL